MSNVRSKWKLYRSVAKVLVCPTVISHSRLELCARGYMTAQLECLFYWRVNLLLPWSNHDSGGTRIIKSDCKCSMNYELAINLKLASLIVRDGQYTNYLVISQYEYSTV